MMKSVYCAVRTGTLNKAVWIPEERRKRGRPRKIWMEGVQAAMTARNLEQDQWINRQEWRLVCGRVRQL
jgi:hypothetical protein